MKVIIAGCRDFNDYKLLSSKCQNILKEVNDIEIVSGNCNGADLLGERFAKENGHNLILFPAEWSVYGLSAGPRRNEEMAEYADALIAFWDGKSTGTGDMIKRAEKHDLKIRIINI